MPPTVFRTPAYYEMGTHVRYTYLYGPKPPSRSLHWAYLSPQGGIEEGPSWQPCTRIPAQCPRSQPLSLAAALDQGSKDPPTPQDQHGDDLGTGLLQGPRMKRRRMSEAPLHSTREHKIARRP